MKTRVYILKDWNGGHRLGIVRDQYPLGKIDVLTGFTWQEHDEGDMFDPQTGIGRADELIQQIVDKAWDEGFRPAGFAEVKNETAAIRDHLSDMKAIAFHQLKIGKTP